MINLTVTFSAEALAAFAVSGLLCIIIPVLSLIIYKIRNKDISVLPFFIGCGVFLLFALVLEQLLHIVMLPLVQNSAVLYTVYGALAAGVFEETGRFAAFKTVMKKQTDPRSSVMYGLGHGGFEAIVLVGVNMLSYFALGLMTNTLGVQEVIKLTANGDATAGLAILQQLDALSKITFGNCLLSVLERVIAMTFHTAISVLVFEAARVKGRVWLYPAAILLHALLDVPAALYQRQVVGLPVCYVIMTIFTGVVVFLAVGSFKRMRKYTAENADTNTEERKEQTL